MLMVIVSKTYRVVLQNNTDRSPVRSIFGKTSFLALTRVCPNVKLGGDGSKPRRKNNLVIW